MSPKIHASACCVCLVTDVTSLAVAAGQVNKDKLAELAKDLASSRHHSTTSAMEGNGQPCKENQKMACQNGCPSAEGVAKALAESILAMEAKQEAHMGDAQVTIMTMKYLAQIACSSQSHATEILPRPCQLSKSLEHNDSFFLQCACLP